MMPKIFRQPKGLSVAELLSSAEANVEAIRLREQQVLRVRKSTLELTLRAIKKSLTQHDAYTPALTLSIGSIDDYNFQRLATANLTRKGSLGVARAARFSDGLAVVFATAGWLEDKRHSLILPTDGEPQLTVSAFNVDAQAIGSATKNLEGLTNIAEDEMSVGYLQYCAGALAVDRQCDWQHALSPQQLAGVLRPKPPLVQEL